MICPNGHESASTDWCDVCGEAMGPAPAASPTPAASGNPLDSLDLPSAPDGAPVPAAPVAAPVAEAPPSGAEESGGQECPNCHAISKPEALFCETCGYDFTTGSMPRRGPSAGEPVPAGGIPENVSATLDPPWVAEIWIDPAWYASQASPDPLPSAGPPVVIPLHHRSLLIGRTSTSRDIHPDIECGADNGVSRRHAELTTDGTRWWIDDLQSSNGTYVGDAVGGIPTESIRPGAKREVDADDRIYVGSWTRIVLRPAMDGEV